MDSKDIKYIQRSLEIASNGLGLTAPNPLVGAVIVYNNQIIGEGYHHLYGGNHAEVEAINSVTDKSLLKKSILYVNLEPCSHFGKTPPCTNLIIQCGIPKVVIGTLDSFIEVRGKGKQKLLNAGVNVEVANGIVNAECKFLNRRFFTFHDKKRPYVILKWAQTKDGFIDVKRKANCEIIPTWITNPNVRTLVHKWRTEEQAIMVGTNTAFFDNPRLNARNWVGKSPLRILLDKNLRLNKSLNLFNQIEKTLVFTEKKSVSANNLQYVTVTFNDNVLNKVLEYLHSLQIQSVIIEGGAALLNSFIETGLWDEARVFVGDMYFNDGIKAPQLNNIPVTSEQLLGSSLLYYVKQ